MTPLQHASAPWPDLLVGGVGDVAALPQGCNAGLTEVAGGAVGVEALPGVQDHGGGGQQVQRVLGLWCGLGLILLILPQHPRISTILTTLAPSSHAA